MSRGVGIAVKETARLPDAADGHEGPANDDPMAQKVARLNAGQLDCLRLVDAHLSSKEIAGELGISPHTVDQRIRQALAILGVERRTQAARVTPRARTMRACNSAISAMAASILSSTARTWVATSYAASSI